MMQLIGTAVLAFCALCAAILDVRFRRLPNWLAALTALAGLAVVSLEAGGIATAWAAGHAAIALVAGAILFRIGAIGGGDAKFYAGCACWFVLQDAFGLLLSVSLAGLVLVIVWFGFSRLRRKARADAKGEFALVPYGLAIAAGAMITRVIW